MGKMRDIIRETMDVAPATLGLVPDRPDLSFVIPACN